MFSIMIYRFRANDRHIRTYKFCSSDSTIKKARFLIECGVKGEQHIDQETLDDSIVCIRKRKNMVSEHLSANQSLNQLIKTDIRVNK